MKVKQLIELLQKQDPENEVGYKSKQLLNQIIFTIRLHRQWNKSEWIYNNMSREYIIYLNNLCDQLEEP